MNRSCLVSRLLAAGALLLFGCQHTENSTVIATGPKLDTRAVVYVGIPADAYYKKDLAIDSGRQTASMPLSRSMR